MMSKTYYFAPLFVVTAFELKICRGKSGTFEIACYTVPSCVPTFLHMCPWFLKCSFYSLQWKNFNEVNRSLWNKVKGQAALKAESIAFLVLSFPIIAAAVSYPKEHHCCH